MVDSVQFLPQQNATPPIGTKVATVNIDGIDYQAVIIADENGNTATVSNRVQTPTGKVLQVQIGPGDIISNIPVFIPFDHHQVHEGEMWQWSFLGAVNSTSKDVRISVPALVAPRGSPHLLAEVIADPTTSDIMLYEGTTFTAVGTDDSSNIFNHNRNVVGSPGTKIYVSGGTALTPNALGTKIYQGYIFTGKAGSNAVDRASQEWILKFGTEYLFRVTTSASGKVLIRFNFYEDLGV